MTLAETLNEKGAHVQYGQNQAHVLDSKNKDLSRSAKSYTLVTNTKGVQTWPHGGEWYVEASGLGEKHVASFDPDTEQWTDGT